VIGLQRPRGWRPADGACFEIRFESGRQLSGGVLESRVAKLATDAGGHGAWQWGMPDAPPLERAVALLKSGSTVKEVKRALGVSPSTAYRLRTRAIARGLLPNLTLTESR